MTVNGPTTNNNNNNNNSANDLNVDQQQQASVISDLDNVKLTKQPRKQQQSSIATFTIAKARKVKNDKKQVVQQQAAEKQQSTTTVAKGRTANSTSTYTSTSTSNIDANSNSPSRIDVSIIAGTLYRRTSSAAVGGKDSISSNKPSSTITTRSISRGSIEQYNSRITNSRKEHSRGGDSVQYGTGTSTTVQEDIEEGIEG